MSSESPKSESPKSESLLSVGEVVADPEVWVDQYGDYLYRYALARVRDASLAEEIVQDTFLAGLRALEQFRGEGSQRGWLMGILRNKIIDTMRLRNKQSGHGAVQHEYDPTAVLFDEHGRWKVGALPIVSPEKLVETEELWELVRNCLTKIPPRQADVFVLSVIEEMGQEQICRELNISVSNYWVRMHRARLGLAKCVGSKWFQLEQSASDE